MQQELLNTAEIIDNFIEGCIDKRTGPYINLKTAQSLSREAIEKKLSDNPVLKKIITNNDGQYLWTKDFIVNYTILKMQHQAIIWEIDDYKSIPSQRK